jgi:hypothetical protein
MLTVCARPPIKVTKENTRTQKLKKIWKIQKQMKKEEKELFREFWERSKSDPEVDFDDLFDTF